MKLIRFGKSGEEKPGVAIDDNLYDASEFGEDYNEKFFETGGLRRLEKFLKENKKYPSQNWKQHKTWEPGIQTIKNCLYWFELCRPRKRNKCCDPNRTGCFFKSYFLFVRAI